MGCAGFVCTKNVLAALNVLYILISMVLIGVAAYSRAVAIVTNLALVGSIVACGVFLLLIAIIGLVGAVRHHQVLLFFYMIILFVLFLLQFSLACACLAVNKEQQRTIIMGAWGKASIQERKSVQKALNCCGFDSTSPPANDSSCVEVQCCHDDPTATCCTDAPSTSSADCPCSLCWSVMEPKTDSAFKITGGVGLIFSFTEIIGVWLAIRYRNLKNPRANPGAFL